MLDRVGKEAFVMLAVVALGYVAAGSLGAAICATLAAMIALVLWTPLRGWLGIPPKKAENAAEATGRVGYRGRPGSYGNLKNATFGDKLGIAIDNEGDVDASEADIK